MKELLLNFVDSLSDFGGKSSIFKIFFNISEKFINLDYKILVFWSLCIVRIRVVLTTPEVSPSGVFGD